LLRNEHRIAGRGTARRSAAPGGTGDPAPCASARLRVPHSTRAAIVLGAPHETRQLKNQSMVTHGYGPSRAAREADRPWLPSNQASDRPCTTRLSSSEELEGPPGTRFTDGSCSLSLDGLREAHTWRNTRPKPKTEHWFRFFALCPTSGFSREAGRRRFCASKTGAWRLHRLQSLVGQLLDLPVRYGR
jgi:hypothetical protein